MKQFAIPALAALALAACSETNNYEADDAAAVDATDTAAAPAMTDDAVNADLDAPTTADTTADGDRVSVSEDGVDADIADGNTRIRADVDGDPSLTVETD